MTLDAIENILRQGQDFILIKHLKSEIEESKEDEPDAKIATVHIT